MKYLSQAAWAWLLDWVAPKWTALKAKAAAVFQKLRARNTGDADGSE